MNGAAREEIRQALVPTDYVEHGQVWVPRSTVPAAPQRAPEPHRPAAAPAVRIDSAPPEQASDLGGQVVTVGAPGRQLSAATGVQATGTVIAPNVAGGTGEVEELPEGVMARVTNGMALAIGTVALVAMSEAAFNLGRFVFKILELPLPLAVGFPAIFEAAAASFAVQDMRDRRAGHASRAMRVATYLTLTASSIVNGVVGFVANGGAGLVEILPPLMLAGVIHLHGDRATRAHHSQAVLRPAWRKAQLLAAQRESVLDVLPLLAGNDVHGRATVELLSRRLESATLEPGEALIAAGWHERQTRDMPASMLRRLETVAATVWGDKGPPAETTVSVSIASLTPSRTASAAASLTPSRTASATPSLTLSRSASQTRSLTPSRSTSGSVKADDVTLAQLVAEARATRPGAGEGSVRILLKAKKLTASSARIRDALSAQPVSGSTPPQVTVSQTPDQGTSAIRTPGDTATEGAL